MSYPIKGEGVFAVVLVGGKGKRLRPLSSDSRPKAFLSVTKDRKTMFRKTLDRISKIIPKDNIVIVANKAHKNLVKDNVSDIADENLLLEPLSRNTAPAITYASSTLNKRIGDAVLVVIPTDQYIADERRYLAAMKKAVGFVTKNPDAVVVFGAKPTEPATGFGYIRVKGQGSGSKVAGCRVKGKKEKDIYKVERFVEKPSLGVAKKYLHSKMYLWNMGAFVFRARTLLDLMKELSPKVRQAFDNLNDIARSYRTCPAISIDYAIMEKAPNVYCVRGSFGWQDMGSFESLMRVLKRESRKFVVKNGKVTKIL